LHRHPPRLLAVTFDATGTLLACPRLGEIYAEVLGRHGIDADPAEVRRLFSAVWRELDCRAVLGRDRFTTHPGGARGFWARLLERLAEHLGAPPPSPFAAAELYNRFAHAEAWEVYPEVRPVLTELAGRGLALGVVANWDERLPGLLAELGLDGFFRTVVTSADAGTEKPDPAIFHQVVERLGVLPEAALHVGDDRLRDLEGARAAGLEAFHLVRSGRGGDLADLSPLCDLLPVR
jgi:putative hydrolase of the HAD superfamily